MYTIKEFEVLTLEESVGGTSLQGTIFSDYNTLCNVLGKPTFTDADPNEKVSCEWCLKVKYWEEGADVDDWDYADVTVYAWKYGCIPVEECQWNVGGKSWIATDLIETILAEDIANAA
jgi:hypothetical protein